MRKFTDPISKHLQRLKQTTRPEDIDEMEIPPPGSEDQGEHRYAGRKRPSSKIEPDAPSLNEDQADDTSPLSPLSPRIRRRGLFGPEGLFQSESKHLATLSQASPGQTF